MSEKEQKPPRDLSVEPLGPGEFPVPGDTDTSIVRNETLTAKWGNGGWGICHWTWPDDSRPLPPTRPDDQGGDG
jgi:hypothetical protein